MTAAAPTTPVAQGVQLNGLVPGVFVLVVLGVVGAALLVSFLAGLTQQGRPSAPPRGGTVTTNRTRLWVGLAVIGLAALVGAIGWYRISGEPALDRQLPILASAGIAVVVLSVLGGALIVAEQLGSDQSRIGELEDAVRALTEAVAPAIEREPRHAEVVPVTARRPKASRAVQ